MPRPREEKICDAIDVHSLSYLELKAYWALEKLTTQQKDRFSSSEIAEYLVETVGISTSRQAIKYALGKNRRACNSNKQGYKLMEDGRVELRQHAGHEKVRILEPNKSYTAKNHVLKDFLGTAYKELSLCDTYVDHNTLDVIFTCFKKGVPVRVLTSQVSDKPTGTFKRQLTELSQEGFSVEVRTYNSSVLHDRYLMTEKMLLLSGNSLNGLGKKESFLVALGPDILQSVMSTFNSRWKNATPI